MSPLTISIDMKSKSLLNLTRDLQVEAETKVHQSSWKWKKRVYISHSINVSTNIGIFFLLSWRYPRYNLWIGISIWLNNKLLRDFHFTFFPPFHVWIKLFLKLIIKNSTKSKGLLTNKIKPFLILFIFAISSCKVGFKFD